MDKLLKRCFRLFWLWKEEKEMEWLRQMSSKGWHLINICIFIYTFEKGEPKDIVYYGDFKSIKKRDIDEYLDIFRDAGWKYICRQGNWFYFSSPANNKYKEVYTDNQSRLTKYSALLTVHVIAIVLIVNSINSVSKRALGNEFNIADILFFIVLIALIALSYSTIRLIVLVTKLRKSSKE